MSNNSCEGCSQLGKSRYYSSQKTGLVYTWDCMSIGRHVGLKSSSETPERPKWCPKRLK